MYGRTFNLFRCALCSNVPPSPQPLVTLSTVKIYGIVGHYRITYQDYSDQQHTKLEIQGNIRKKRGWGDEMHCFPQLLYDIV